LILGFPLGLIIPFVAYRSLAREFEDGTINLISIITMKPYQIVIGKFGSAFLQMLIYPSVLAPCICFTYMLRGISLNQIVLGISICIGGLICLTVLGLFLAGVFRSRTLGVGASVLFVLLLGWLYYYYYYYYYYCCWCELMGQFTRYSSSSDFEDAEFVTHAMLLLAGHYWLGMGFMMIGESVFVFRRVQRTLPRTFLSRSGLRLHWHREGCCCDQSRSLSEFRLKRENRKLQRFQWANRSTKSLAS